MSAVEGVCRKSCTLTPRTTLVSDTHRDHDDRVRSFFGPPRSAPRVDEADKVGQTDDDRGRNERSREPYSTRFRIGPVEESSTA